MPVPSDSGSDGKTTLSTCGCAVSDNEKENGPGEDGAGREEGECDGEERIGERAGEIGPRAGDSGPNLGDNGPGLGDVGPGEEDRDDEVD